MTSTDVGAGIEVMVVVMVVIVVVVVVAEGAMRHQVGGTVERAL